MTYMLKNSSKYKKLRYKNPFTVTASYRYVIDKTDFRWYVSYFKRPFKCSNTSNRCALIYSNLFTVYSFSVISFCVIVPDSLSHYKAKYINLSL